MNAEAPLQLIAERDLLLCIRSQSLRRLTIVRMAGGPYQLRASLSFEPGEMILANVRGKARQWASLDRLANHIRSKYGAPACLAIDLSRADAGTPVSRAEEAPPGD
jgi:hypothetical protein